MPSFLFLIENGAGGYLECADLTEARSRAERISATGWLFRCWSAGYSMGRRRRSSRKLVQLEHVSTLGKPPSEALATALDALANRHHVDFEFPARDYE
ncbi:hypothetical protein [Paracraurococcus lichenis]|uniref:Uncharacterized protein n=1 Tax=Paracraurococcus lichenis TaxID=3064888 RepID=A0ABT9EBK7_9PROT|nr:hypothetical protein [Paracraurococcus sp. LOR1-02]MDO9713597.1 hypothetical protein [Paracraurococcus sp. LOR1-02]